MRQGHPGMFYGAPRFHNGLKVGEFPAILERGEAVIPKQSVRNARSAAASSGQFRGGGDTYINVTADARGSIGQAELEQKAAAAAYAATKRAVEDNDKNSVNRTQAVMRNNRRDMKRHN